MSTYPNYRFREAITWAIIADLMRRHEAKEKLFVVETHPCTGQYDIRGIVRPGDNGGELSFNIQSGNLHRLGSFMAQREMKRPPWAPFDELAGPFGYVEAVLQADDRMDVVRHIEALAGLPSPAGSPATTRHALSFRLMAEIAARSMLGGTVVRWEWGWQGPRNNKPDATIHHAVKQIPEIAVILPDLANAQQSSEQPWDEFWVCRTSQKSADSLAMAAINVYKAVWHPLQPTADPVDLMAVYNKCGRSIRRLADVLAA